MALSPSDYEYIRRIGDAPTEQEATALRVLRRKTTDPADVRLLDKLLATADGRQTQAGERTRLQNRLAYLQTLQTAAGRSQVDRSRKLELRRWARNLTEREHLAQDLAHKRATEHYTPLWAAEDKAQAVEAKEIEARLQELV